MDKLSRVINCTIDKKVCNFSCSYCITCNHMTQENTNMLLPYSPEHMAQALSSERMGGVCLFIIGGTGETLLPQQMVEFIRMLLEDGHYILLVTNGSLDKRFDEIASFPRGLLERLIVSFSIHWFELKRLNLIDNFFGNVEKMRLAGASINLTLVASDIYLSEINDIREICQERTGALCQLNEVRDDDDTDTSTEDKRQKHIEFWQEKFQSERYEFFIKLFEYDVKSTFCYAGEYIAELELTTGNLRQCNIGQFLQNIFVGIDEPIHFCAIGHNCPSPFCGCSGYLSFGGVSDTFSCPVDLPNLMNRVCADGTEWLTEKAKETLSHTVRENRKRYTPERMAFIDMLMSKVYKNSMDIDVEKSAAAAAIQALITKGYKTIGVFDDREAGTWFAEVLNGSPVKVKFLVTEHYESDRHPDLKKRLKRSVKYLIKKVLRYDRNKPAVVLNPEDHWPNVDAVIVANYAYYLNIKEWLHKVNNSKALLVPIIELVL